MSVDQASAKIASVHEKAIFNARMHYRLAFVVYVALVCICIFAAATASLDSYTLNILLETSTYAFSVMGISVVLGLCGQITLTQAAFFGIGAYGVGLGTVDMHLPFWLCLSGGLVLAGIAGFLLGMSTLRLGGHYLAMVTISFQVIVNLVMTNAVWLTHGPDGIRNIGRPLFFESSQAYLALCIGILGTIGYVVWRLPDTRLGRAMRAVRDNELAARVAGINVFHIKLIAFVIAAALGGLGGGLFASGFTYVSPDQFSYTELAIFLTMCLLGGVTSPVGSVIGTVLLVLLPEWLRFLKSVPGLYLAIYGLGVIFIIVFMPNGIWGFCVSMLTRWRKLAGPVLAEPGPLRLEPATGGDVYVLKATGLSKQFGGLKAVDCVDLSVRRGAIHALIGPNGSGKTTLLNMLSGIYQSSGGVILLDGRDITRLPIHARSGVGRTFQNIRLFRSMTALENVVIGAERRRHSFGGGQNHAAVVERARAALDFVGLEKRAGELVSGFSYGHQRLIEIARALAGNPTLLLLDEPAAGLNSTEKLEVQALLGRISKQGLTILIIDHDISLVRSVAQHTTVLNFGRRIADGESVAVLNHPDVISAYLGSD